MKLASGGTISLVESDPSAKDLGIKQLFARYQTPTDNAWIETWFRLLKWDWLRFKDYVSFDQLKKFIREFVKFYNTQRHHGVIGYVTPEQKHSGQAEKTLEARAERKGSPAPTHKKPSTGERDQAASSRLKCCSHLSLVWC